MKRPVTPYMADALTGRLMRFFLRRIRRLSVLDLYTRAAKIGLLEAHGTGDFGEKLTFWSATTPCDLLSGDPERDRRVIARLLKSPSTATQSAALFDDDPIDRIVDIPYEPDPQDRSESRAAILRAARAFDTVDQSGVPMVFGTSADSQLRLALIRSLLPPPDVTKIAVALLVARAAGTRLAGIDDLRQALSPTDPFVLIKVPIEGFETRFGLALEEGVILPFWPKPTDHLGSIALSNRYGEKPSGKKRRKIVTGSGKAIAKTKETLVRRLIGNVLSDTHLPLIIADETSTDLMPSLVETADLVLECGAINEVFLSELLSICCGIPCAETLRQFRGAPFDLTRLHLDDLTMAIRPGRSIEAILFTLETLARPIVDRDAASDDGETEDRKGRGGLRKAADAPSAVDIVYPEPEIEKAGEGEHVRSTSHAGTSGPKGSGGRLSIETLTGYGDATSWALDLKTDLTVWREGGLDWSDMSTKLLLSGPPGTGKTTFARALCNSLCVPLVISSVTSWLEPGYLGDVLQRMSSAFKTSQAKAPCILLIDEIDGIGSRAGGSDRTRPYDDYWTSLVNRLLELLDGALKSEGVIVVAATNFPERIDPALLRSGRLEKHIVIPMPDVDALTGILVHHLGSDLQSVLASAPTMTKRPTHQSPDRKTSVLPRTNRSQPHGATFDDGKHAENSNNRTPLHD
ncbi:ATP-binding protein [Rhizobium sp. LjRoot30]|uniref:ATP-binding protein n=1 Tax=Rhizobium sp. LjRoot30 TaxID=3342320 RepID=UPI003ED05240